MSTLDGKIALVTGAGSGIGAAIAERFAHLGAQVLVTDVDEAAAGRTVQRIRASARSAEAVSLDVTRE
jgi:3-oxoacyl-[acyl-carrier protein] reductase